MNTRHFFAAIFSLSLCGSAFAGDGTVDEVTTRNVKSKLPFVDRTKFLDRGTIEYTVPRKLNNGIEDDDLPRRLLASTDRPRGICAVIGGDGSLALSLAQNSEFLVYARIGGNAALDLAAAAARKQGLLNRRLYLSHGRCDLIPFADNYVDLLVVHASCNMGREEMMRGLSPGGKGFVFSDGRLDALPDKTLPAACDDWSHWFHGPDNNPVSSDAVLQWPLLLQWLGKPYDGSQPKVTVVAAGRAFCASGEAYSTYHTATQFQKAEAHTLKAINVFNGNVLWQRKLRLEDQVGRPAFVATDQTLTMIQGHRVLCLDAETGDEQKAIDLGGEKRIPKWIALKDGVLYALLGDPEVYGDKWRRGQKYPLGNTSRREPYSADGSLKLLWGFGDELVACDLEAGKTLWSHKEPAHDIDARQIGIHGRRLFFSSFGKHVACLNSASGEIVWKNESEDLRKALAPGLQFRDHPLSYPRPGLLCTGDVIVVSYPESKGNAVLSVSDGTLLWTTASRAPHCFSDGGKINMTGRPVAFYDPLTGAIAEDRKGIAAGGCGPVTVSRHGYYGRHGMIFDRAAGQRRLQHTYRGGCWQDCIPANGLLLTAPYVCGCNYSLRGWIVQSPAGGVPFDKEATETERLERGPAFEKIDNHESKTENSNDWPTHRANNTRSGFLPVDVSAAGQLLWTAKASEFGLATPPVAIGDVVFVVGDDGVVRSLAASDGTTNWQFPTGGRIHAAPTVCQGGVFVGSADGFIYAIEAATGRLVWRFRAAPAERQIMVYGHLSSTWPVNTGVLVKDGVAYAAAGLMDSDGTHVYALDAATGEIKWQNNSCGHVDRENLKGALAHGYLTIGKGRLWMCAGSAASPASFDLTDGTCAMPSYFAAGSREGIRGREIGLFSDEFIIQGGQLLHWDQPGERLMRKGCQMTFVRLGADGQMSMPPVIPFDSSTALPVWDNQSLFTRHVVERKPRIACVRVTSLNAWLAALQASREESFKQRQSWEPVAIDLTGRTRPAGSTALEREALAWEKPLDPYALALTNNVMVAVHPVATDAWQVTVLDRSTGEELWHHPLPDEPLLNGLCVDRRGNVLVALIDGRVLCLGNQKTTP